MAEIKIEALPTSVNDQDWLNFTVASDGLYAITITARCKSWIQNILRLFNDDDLAVQVDDYFFGELGGKKREFNIVGSWNGNELKNSFKAVIFLVPLKTGDHKITFWTDKSPWVEKIEVALLPFGAKEFVVPAPANVAAVDLVFKNVIPEKIIAMNLAGVGKPMELGTAWSPGIRLARVLKIGGSLIKSLVVTIADASIPYKIGLVKLYQDITLLPEVHLYAEAKTASTPMFSLSDGAEVEILDEKVVGEWIGGKSNIWHKIRRPGQEGFVLSSFVEIQGQERDKIIDLIKAKCIEPEVDVDANIMLAIAGVESHYKPYAVALDEYGKEAQGVFQLRQAAADTVKIDDRLDVYKNVDGGVRYYKLVQDNKKIKGRGYILEQRLLAWHNGPTAVETGRDNYKTIAPSSAGAKFVRNVLANIQKRDWKKIIKVAVILLVTGLNYGLGLYWFPEEVRYVPLNITFDQPWAESAYAAGNLELQPDPDANGIELKSNYGIKKIIVSGLVDKSNHSFTELAYWGDQGEKKIILDGKFSNAGWNNVFFTVARYREDGETPTTFFSETNGLFKPVKFFYKDGRVEDEMYGPEFLNDLPSLPVGEVKDTSYNYKTNQIEETITEFFYDSDVNKLVETGETKRTRELPEQYIDQANLRVSWDKTANEILLSTPFKTVYHFPAGQLVVGDDFDVAGERGGTLHIHGIVKNATGGVLYFLTDSFADCGAQNCHSALYRFNQNDGQIQKIKEDVFGAVASLELSPDNKHLAIITSVHGGFCNSGTYVSILNAESLKEAPVPGFANKFFSFTYIASSTWKNNNEFAFFISQACGGKLMTRRNGDYIYNLTADKLRKLKEEFLPEGNG